mgnify:CR=1 FL=1
MTSQRDLLRSIEADAYDTPQDASAQAQDDFRRHEILEMNATAEAEARSQRLAVWGVVGLVAVVVFGTMFSNPRRSR